MPSQNNAVTLRRLKIFLFHLHGIPVSQALVEDPVHDFRRCFDLFAVRDLVPTPHCPEHTDHSFHVQSTRNTRL